MAVSSSVQKQNKHCAATAPRASAHRCIVRTNWSIDAEGGALLLCAMSSGAASKLERRADGDHGRSSGVDGLDDLGVVDALQIHAAPRGAMRREMTDEQHLIRAGWKAGPGLMQRPGEAEDLLGAGSRAVGEASLTM